MADYDDDSQGGRANRQGDSMHETIARMLLGHGFVEVQVSARAPKLADFAQAVRCDLRRPKKAFACHVPLCQSVHAQPYPAHFLLRTEDWPEPLAVMGRTQNSNGSAIEKLEFMYATIAERFPCRCLLAFSGAAFTPEVLRRARHWIERSNGRIARVFAGLDDLRTWLASGHPFPATPAPALPGV